MVIMPPSSSEPPRNPNQGSPWFGLICIALAILMAWLVVQLSPQKTLLAGSATKLSQLELPDSLHFLQGRGFVVVVAVALAILLWAAFRRPRSE